MTDPINPTDDSARALAQNLLQNIRFAALAVTHPDSGVPYVARVAMLWHDGALLTLVSTLSLHTKALAKNSACAALIGEPGDKGDPLTHPRMTLMCTAQEVDKSAYKATWLAAIPKAQLYYDFSDFRMYALAVSEAHLNGGFGKAFTLSADDLGV
ncbi:pyridoxamine 5-phosphate oxidase [Yoonia sp. R78084]|uniref:pyridoxamine 5-phosphate oxidase n=1 Tax=Yoonia sp. R78084 TaxID=3093869 RepID=UPI0037DC4997